jgi:hypothetical protein
LLSMKPVFDADNIYRYVIGVQFEVKEDSNLKQRLVQLDKLLRLLPSKLNLRSKASARAKGAMAVKVTGEANQMISNKEAILQQSKQMESQEQNKDRPRAIAAIPMETPMSQLNLDNTVFGFTKIVWMGSAKEIMPALALDPIGKETFDRFVKTTSHVYQSHWDFLCKFMQIATAQVRWFPRHSPFFSCRAAVLRLGCVKIFSVVMFLCDDICKRLYVYVFVSILHADAHVSPDLTIGMCGCAGRRTSSSYSEVPHEAQEQLSLLLHFNGDCIRYS